MHFNVICYICEYSSTIFEKYISKCNLPSWHYGKELLRYKCPNCGVIFGTLEMIHLSLNELKESYIKLYKEYHESDSTARDIVVFNYLELKPGQTTINWGSGYKTNIVNVAKEQDITVIPYDPFMGNSELTGKYDGIFSNNMMEHLQNPVAELKKMKGYLKDDGVMIHKTPCWKYCYTQTEYHLYFFEGKSVEIMAEKVGLVAERLQDNCIKFRKKNLNGKI